MKKQRSERNGRRSLDTAIQYDAVRTIARKEPRTSNRGGPRFDDLKDLALHGLTSKLPKLGPLVDNAAKTAKAAQDLANEAKKEGCQ